jgi:hypothetical protein
MLESVFHVLYSVHPVGDSLGPQQNMKILASYGEFLPRLHISVVVIAYCKKKLISYLLMEVMC